MTKNRNSDEKKPGSAYVDDFAHVVYGQFRGGFVNVVCRDGKKQAEDTVLHFAARGITTHILEPNKKPRVGRWFRGKAMA